MDYPNGVVEIMAPRFRQLARYGVVAVFHALNVFFSANFIVGGLAWYAPFLLPPFLRAQISRVDPLTTTQWIYVSFLVTHAVFSATGLIAAIASCFGIRRAKAVHQLFLAWAGAVYLYMAVVEAPRAILFPEIQAGVAFAFSLLAFFSLILLIRKDGQPTAVSPRR